MRRSESSSTGPSERDTKADARPGSDEGRAPGAAPRPERSHPSGSSRSRSSRPLLGVLLRYGALQLPGLVVCILAVLAAHHWLDLPRALAAGAVAVWIAKDAILFPFVREAYEPGPGKPHRDLIDASGVAPDGLVEEGYVRIGPELWRARRAQGCPPLAPGEPVRVVDMTGFTLTVDRDRSGD
ncbi:MAG TPA: NfeD family protein [Myxococcota bacterium]|nr:NfeD family protein [Myxococcota bacterium]